MLCQCKNAAYPPNFSAGGLSVLDPQGPVVALLKFGGTLANLAVSGKVSGDFDDLDWGIEG